MRTSNRKDIDRVYRGQCAGILSVVHATADRTTAPSPAAPLTAQGAQTKLTSRKKKGLAILSLIIILIWRQVSFIRYEINK